MTHAKQTFARHLRERLSQVCLGWPFSVQSSAVEATVCPSIMRPINQTTVAEPCTMHCPLGVPRNAIPVTCLEGTCIGHGFAPWEDRCDVHEMPRPESALAAKQ